MNGSDVLRTGFGFSHQVLESVIRDLDPETLHAQLPRAMIGSVAAIYAHAVFAEDLFVQRSAHGKEPVHVSGGWSGRTGVQLPASPMQSPAWDTVVRIDDLVGFRAYAKAVYGATDEYVAELKEADLDRPFDAGQRGTIPLGSNASPASASVT